MDKATDTLRAEAVDIFVRGDPVEDFGFRQVLREGGLNEDAMDGGVGIQGVKMGEELLFADGLGEELKGGLHADFGGGLLLLGHIRHGGRVIAHADEGDMRDNRGQFGDPFLDFGEDLLGDGVSVNEAHVPSVGQGGPGGREKSVPRRPIDCLALHG